MDKFIHIPEPRFSILVIKIITHGPHYVVCTRNICLIKEASEVRFRSQFKTYFWIARENQKLLQQMKVYLCYGCRNKIINTLFNIIVKQQQVVLPRVVNELKLMRCSAKIWRPLKLLAYSHIPEQAQCHPKLQNQSHWEGYNGQGMHL
jgi:hypothetical protein